MVYGLGAFFSDDDEYTDFEVRRNPYFCREQIFASAAAFSTRKTMFHGPRRVGARLRFGGGSGGRTGAGAIPAPASSAGAGAGEKKKKKLKKQRQRISRSPPSPPPPVTQNLVVGSSLEFSEKVNAQTAMPLPPSLIEDDLVLGSSLEVNFSESERPNGGGGRSGGGGGERADTVPAAAASGTVGKKKKKKNKKKMKKTGTANAHISAPTPAIPSTTNDAFMDLLLGGSRFGCARCGGGGVLASEPSEDDSELSDLSDIGYGVFGGYDGYPGYDDYDDHDDYEDYEDSDDEYIAYCVDKICSKIKPFSRKVTKTSRAARDDDYSCNLCMESVGVKHEYLLHMAILHRLCGACERGEEEKKKNKSGFESRDHFKSSLNCPYNLKFKLGRVEITELPDSQAVDNPKLKLGRFDFT